MLVLAFNVPGPSHSEASTSNTRQAADVALAETPTLPAPSTCPQKLGCTMTDTRGSSGATSPLVPSSNSTRSRNVLFVGRPNGSSSAPSLGAVSFN